MTMCFLSGQEIPSGQYSKEHLAPKSKVPYQISRLRENIVPACKILNTIKGDLFFCEWKEKYYERCMHALFHYKLKPKEKKIIKRLLINGFPDINPCKHCVCSIYKDYCIKSR